MVSIFFTADHDYVAAAGVSFFALNFAFSRMFSGVTTGALVWSDNELSLAVGETVEVLCGVEDWWYGKVDDREVRSR